MMGFSPRVRCALRVAVMVAISTLAARNATGQQAQQSSAPQADEAGSVHGAPDAPTRTTPSDDQGLGGLIRAWRDRLAKVAADNSRDGLFPVVGFVTPGSGLSAGVGYRDDRI